MDQYNPDEAGKILGISGAGVRKIIREKKLVDGKNIIKKTNFYIINKKGIEIIKSYTRGKND
jgi:hypothetical protein